MPLLALGISAALAAPQQDAFKKQYQDKLGKPFFKKASWITDYDTARAEAKKSSKIIFTYFSRSYAP